MSATASRRLPDLKAFGSETPVEARAGECAEIALDEQIFVERGRRQHLSMRLHRCQTFFELNCSGSRKSR
jgi:hypothetical protein